MIILDNLIESVRALKEQPGKSIMTDGSSQLVHELLRHDLVDELHLLLYPLTLGGGKRLLPDGVHATFKLESARTYPTGVVGLTYTRANRELQLARFIADLPAVTGMAASRFRQNELQQQSGLQLADVLIELLGEIAFDGGDCLLSDIVGQRDNHHRA